jgi:hypothetical protein
LSRICLVETTTNKGSEPRRLWQISAEKHQWRVGSWRIVVLICIAVLLLPGLLIGHGSQAA